MQMDCCDAGCRKQDRGLLAAGAAQRAVPREGVPLRRKSHPAIPPCPQTLCDSGISLFCQWVPGKFLTWGNGVGWASWGGGAGSGTASAGLGAALRLTHGPVPVGGGVVGHRFTAVSGVGAHPYTCEGKAQGGVGLSGPYGSLPTWAVL